MSLKYSFLSAALAVALTSSASAALIAYEGFDYTEANDTALTGLSGGIGWTEAYPSVTSSGGTQIIADGLSFTGIPSSGKSAQRTASATLTGNGRNWAATLTAGTYWYSFLMKPTSTAAANGRGTFGLLQNGSGSDNQNGYGIRFDRSGTAGPTATLTFQSQSPSQAGGSSISFATGWNSTYLVVGKLVVTVTTTTTVANSVWIYKEGTAVPADEAALGTAMTTVSNSVTATPLPAMYGRSFGDSAPTFFDEVRVGTAYIDVITAVASGVAPSIVTQPASVSFFTGQNASMSIGVTGTPPFTYSWRKLAGATPDVTDEVLSTNSTLSFSPAATTNSGTYYVIVSNATEPSVTSSTAILTVVDPVAASITTQPTAATVNAGATATLSVVAAGSPAPTYQWQKLTAQDTFSNVVGATSATLNITNTDFLAEGDYRCVVSYSVPGVAGSSTTTNSDTVTVTALIDPSEGDTDNDGMADSLEKYLRNLGFAVGVSNTAKVQSLINSGYPVSFTGTPPASEVNELALTATTVTRLSDGRLELSFGLKEAASPSSTFTTKALTTDDVSVTNGKIILSVGDGFGGETDFYRLSTETK
jgi:hypothetical protein